MINATLDLIQATVQLDQPAAPGERTVGTGFLISTRNVDGSPQTVLITAKHVFSDMKGEEVRIGYRTGAADGTWTFAPSWVRIRDDRGTPLWTANPNHDVAAISIKAPPEFARAAIPINYLATDADFSGDKIMPGDELMVLGFPKGLAANGAGFPILRSGRVASYPLTPAASPTFLLDFSVFPGNSGGPVFTTRALQPVSVGGDHPVIAGLLTQQVEINHERLEIGIVTNAKYIAETIDLLHGGRSPPPEPAAQRAEIPGAQPAAETPISRPFWDEPWLWVRDRLYDMRLSVAHGFMRLAALLVGSQPHALPAMGGAGRRTA